MSKLVIVESPTKARTVRNYLPQGYRVEASMGHVRDLPASAEEVPKAYKGTQWAQLGVNVDRGFEPLYVVPNSKQKVIQELQSALEEADELLLATDEDREGESISWHLQEVLQPQVPTKRMVFHEITQPAIARALEQCRELDSNLIQAQETRRILDRLVGYTLSPLLWKKIARGLSAGRVQSVAVRLLVQRERARRAFRSAQYWDLKATLSQNEQPFEARLVALGDQRIATGSDFDPNTGELAQGRNALLLDGKGARELQQRLSQASWTVRDVDERATTRKPYPPFITSTLQQEANRKLKISARETMRVAQSLYEQGYITYMRTDSTHLSDQAIAAARSCVEQKYGSDYLSPKARQYSTSTKGAQEAHEAIRPAGSEFRTPQETGLDGRERSLYELIWKRTVACQMANARLTQIGVRLMADDAEFKASGKRIDFAGFFRAYVEGSDDPEAALEDQEIVLPPLQVGDTPSCTSLEAIEHATQPPGRYTEASLVKTLEQEGIGRPSTYATIIGTIADRGYTQMRGSTLVPTFTAFAVTSLLETYFPDLVDVGFTASMEQTLDEIAAGQTSSLPYLEAFYASEGGLSEQVQQREHQIDAQAAKAINLGDLDVQVRVGRFGPYLEAERDGQTVTASIPDGLTPADLDAERVESLVRQKTEGPDKVGLHPETGEPIYLKIGRYGPYLQLGDATEDNPNPKRSSLPKGVQPEQIDLEQAVGLLSLPRTLGFHPETGAPVKAGLGRFGPYVVHERGKNDRDFRSLKADDNVLTVELDRALALLAQPKRGQGGGRRKAKTPLRELGTHPEDGKAVNVYDGPYGPYVKHGKTNAGIPSGETVESMTLDRALELLADKKSNQGGRKSGKAQSGSKASKSNSSKAKSGSSRKRSAGSKSSRRKTSSSSKQTQGS